MNKISINKQNLLQNENGFVLDLLNRNHRHKYIIYLGIAILLLCCVILQYFDDTFTIVSITLSLSIIIGITFFDFFGAFCLLLFIMPFSLAFFKFEIGVVTLNPFNFGVIVMLIMVWGKRILARKKIKIKWIDLNLFIVCIVFLYATLKSENVFESGRMAFEALFIPVLIYFLLKTQIRNRYEYNQAIAFLLLGLTIFSLFGIIDFFLNPVRNEILSVPAISAATILFASSVAFLFLPIVPMTVRLTCGVLNTVAFFLCMSRVYILVFFGSKIIKILFNKGHAGKLIFLFLFFSLSGTLLLVFNYNPKMKRSMNKDMSKSFERLTNIEHWKESLNGRGMIYSKGLKNFKLHPYIGNGYHRSEIVAAYHSIHIEWLNYGGLIGYFFYALFLFFHFCKMAKLGKDPFISFNLLVIIGILINSVTNSFVLGFIPITAFMFMGFNEAYLNFYSINTSNSK